MPCTSEVTSSIFSKIFGAHFIWHKPCTNLVLAVSLLGLIVLLASLAHFKIHPVDQTVILPVFNGDPQQSSPALTTTASAPQLPGFGSST